MEYVNHSYHVSDYLKTDEEKKLEERLKVLRAERLKKFFKMKQENDERNQKIVEQNRERRKKEFEEDLKNGILKPLLDIVQE
jgi:hypothetical protein